MAMQCKLNYLNFSERLHIQSMNDMVKNYQKNEGGK